jgi:hypothetical protein
MFSEEEIKLILQDFPKFELCYEIMTHKKVLGSSAILAIPDGKKCFAWFTSFMNDNVCFLLDINENKHIMDVQILTTSFTDILALGTVFYGIFFKNKSNNYFCIEDIYYYAGKSCYNLTYLSKLEKIKEIMEKQMSQIALVNKFTIFGLPLIMNDFQLILKEIQLLPYKVSEIKFRFFEKENSKKIMVMKYFKQNTQKLDNNRKEAIFKITADIEPDIYNLFIYNNGTEEYYDIAFIPDYKTSVMMNKLFRNIKENDNLDRIEESDNEEEFEDIREDKYVYLDRSFKMRCEYNSKFKRWTPISLVSKSDKIITMSLLQNY